jgi:hypothetical protein
MPTSEDYQIIRMPPGENLAPLSILARHTLSDWLPITTQLSALYTGIGLTGLVVLLALAG